MANANMLKTTCGKDGWKCWHFGPQDVTWIEICVATSLEVYPFCPFGAFPFQTIRKSGEFSTRVRNKRPIESKILLLVYQITEHLFCQRIKSFRKKTTIVVRMTMRSEREKVVYRYEIWDDLEGFSLMVDLMEDDIWWKSQHILINSNENLI